MTAGPLLTGGWVGAIVAVGVGLGRLVGVALGPVVWVGVAVDPVIGMGLLARGVPDLDRAAACPVGVAGEQAARVRAKITKITLRRIFVVSFIRCIFSSETNYVHV
jgi:hypothetical protein